MTSLAKHWNNFLAFAMILLSAFYLGSPCGIASFWGHLLAAVLVFCSLHKFAVNKIFWTSLIIAVLFASELRLSLEYLLLAFGFLSFSLTGLWVKRSPQAKIWILLILFAVLWYLDAIKIIAYEKGSLTLWLPVFLALACAQPSPANGVAQLIAGIGLFLSNKRASLIAYFTNLVMYLHRVFGLRKIVYFAVGLAVTIALACWRFHNLVQDFASILFRESWTHFFTKSLVPRLYIWASSWDAFLHKPWGHGFGTFAIDFPAYRLQGEFFGGQINQQVLHGHNLWAHFIFELGVFGLAFLLFAFWLLYRNSKPAFWTLLTLSFFDLPLMSFSQYLLAGLLLLPLLAQDEFAAKTLVPELWQSKAKLLAYVFAFVIFVPSLTGQFFYTAHNYDLAIKFDPLHPLYHFTQGFQDLNAGRLVEAELGFQRAVDLNRGTSYFYGFLAAMQLANGQAEPAKLKSAAENIKEAIRLDGGNGHWYLLASLIHRDDTKLGEEYYKKALKRNPEIAYLLHDPRYSATEFIGGCKSDSRISAFYRSGPKIFLPLPYLGE